MYKANLHAKDSRRNTPVKMIPKMTTLVKRGEELKRYHNFDTNEKLFEWKWIPVETKLTSTIWQAYLYGQSTLQYSQ